jgi:hypothetical protein
MMLPLEQRLFRVEAVYFPRDTRAVICPGRVAACHAFTCEMLLGVSPRLSQVRM